MDGNLPEKLSRKYYLKDIKIEQHFPFLNIITVGAEYFTEAIQNCNCVKIGESITQCGQTRILQADNSGTLMDNEELAVRLRGQTPFSNPTRPSGWFSRNVLGRKYGRDDENNVEKPHALIVREFRSSEKEIKELVETCKRSSVPVFFVNEKNYKDVAGELATQVKQHVVRSLLDTRQKEAYQSGYNKGYSEAERANRTSVTNITIHETTTKQNDTESAQPKYRGIPPGSKCPLSGRIMRDPVITPSGNTYERSAIVDHLSRNSTDPISGIQLRNSDLVTNKALKDLIQWLKLYGIV